MIRHFMVKYYSISSYAISGPTYLGNYLVCSSRLFQDSAGVGKIFHREVSTPAVWSKYFTGTLVHLNEEYQREQ